jgi:glycosyltransferase involved in cell wall biosynthesis
MLKLSVNILTWNTFKTTHDTLHILANELQGIDSEVIIVDNGSIDGCQDIATIKNKTNRGISAGKNQGIDASKGEYIMLIDGDIVPVPNSVRCLLRYMEEHKEIDALGFLPNKYGIHKNDYGVQQWCDKLDPVMEHKGHCIYYGMYRRTVFERGVRFDEKFGPGYGWEDLDSYKQMEKLGIKQYVAGINTLTGKYYHEINSSIRVMGHPFYMSTSKAREVHFKEKWAGCLTK